LGYFGRCGLKRRRIICDSVDIFSAKIARQMIHRTKALIIKKFLPS
jgi:hypothetical protein